MGNRWKNMFVKSKDQHRLQTQRKSIIIRLFFIDYRLLPAKINVLESELN